MVMNFLQRSCFKRKYTSYQINLYDFLEETDRALFKKISSAYARPPFVSFPSQNKRKFCAPPNS